ncbi:hypothetical protein HK096_007709, partial [Nowakowskiella sp. JEL0078]
MLKRLSNSKYSDNDIASVSEDLNNLSLFNKGNPSFQIPSLNNFEPNTNDYFEKSKNTLVDHLDESEDLEFDENEADILSYSPSIHEKRSISCQNSIAANFAFYTPENIEDVEPNEEISRNWQPERYHVTRADARVDMKRRFHAIESSPYVLPADIEEQDRLLIQHLLIKYVFGRLFFMPINDVLLVPGSRLLDCGCGTGDWAKDVAQIYPQAKIHALDMSKSLFGGFESMPNISFDEANILDGLPYPDNYFDAVFQRQLQIGIPKKKWDFVIKELVRITKPDGFIEIVEIDTDHQQTGPVWDNFFTGMNQALKLRGLDMEIARNMSDRMRMAGLV